jgi:small subunit ribosomal protein S11
MAKKIALEQNKSSEVEKETPKAATKQGRKKQFATGILHIQSTFNNTKVALSDPKGNAIAWSSSGTLGFKGAKKGTPFAASKVGEVLAEKAAQVGMKEVEVRINGVGAGRESALRAFAGKGLGIISISDITPVPHNGPRPPRARRV